jgi:hypothetical protein
VAAEMLKFVALFLVSHGAFATNQAAAWKLRSLENRNGPTLAGSFSFVSGQQMSPAGTSWRQGFLCPFVL